MKLLEFLKDIVCVILGAVFTLFWLVAFPIYILYILGREHLKKLQNKRKNEQDNGK